MCGRVGLMALLAAAALISTPAAASGPFMIMFESGSAAVTPYGESVIDHAYRWLRSFGEPSVFLEASADTVGSAEENRRLSQERGDTVRTALARRGYPATRIRIVAFGEERLIIETADGVAEPQNRYVMIFIEDGQLPTP